MKLALARQILDATLAAAHARKFQPLAVVVLDARGAIRAALSEDGTSTKRVEIALGKANGAVAMGIGSRDIATRPAHFLAGVTHAVGGMLVPVPGGVLVRDASGEIIGAVGVSGDTSDNDEAAAIGGITASGLVADGG
ncbi:MAG: GlcG protein [Hyphomicrobiales bacterium]|nr:GlcG protein [Hyphomicrobiales bacterium]